MKKLGIIGLSEGNGHPYSWSAIFNGYKPEYMKECQFPAISEYLSKQKYPDNFLNEYARVTHVWTQDAELSKYIAKCSKIDNVSNTIEEMLMNVDAILLARDDAENRLSFVDVVLESGKPIFIDKPFALNTKDALNMWHKQIYENQIFTCSSLRFADELVLTEDDKLNLGCIIGFEASIMKKWSTYAIHLIEPIIIQIPKRGSLLRVVPIIKGEFQQTLVEWDYITGYIKNTGTTSCPLEINFIGKNGTVNKKFNDSFNCFKASLKYFIDLIDRNVTNINKEETLEIVKIIELGII
jgi:hypothetical protein